MFGISRQAYYKRMHSAKATDQENAVVIKLVNEQRREQSRLGTRKIYRTIKPELNNMQIKIGRDKFFTLMRDNGMLIKRRKNFHKTTNSNHRFRKHPNLIKGKVFSKPEQVWVSDITYIKSSEGHFYLSLVTDLYSKKIMGFNLSDNMKTENALAALKMAIGNRVFNGRELIHHSDRGFQYCSDDYTNTLIKNNIQISMTQSYDPYENAVAERVNGILKDEYGIGDGFINQAQAHREIKRAIDLYNCKRPHLTCEYLTPEKAHLVGKYKLRSWSRLSTNKHILTKEKSSKKENTTTNNINFN